MNRNFKLKKSIFLQSTVKICRVATLSLTLFFQQSLLVYAQNSTEEPAEKPQSSTASTIKGIFENVAPSLNKLMQQQQAQQQALAQQAQLQSLINTYKPKFISTAPALNCTMPTPIQDFPLYVCNENKSVSPSSLAQKATNYRYIADQMLNFYDKMKLENSPDKSSGMSCLLEEEKKLSDNIQKSLNSLRSLQAELTKMGDNFKQETKDILLQLDNQHALLNGGLDKSNVEFSKLIGGNCSLLIKQSQALGKSSGLNGIIDTFSNNVNSSMAFNSSAGKIKADIESKISSMQKNISQNGLDAFLDDKEGALDSSSPFLKKKTEKVLKSLNVNGDKIKNSLKESISSMGANADSLLFGTSQFDRKKLTDFLGQADAHFEKQYVNSCALSKTPSDPLNIDFLLTQVNDTNSGNSATNIEAYRKAVDTILKYNDDFLLDKIDLIKELKSDPRFKHMLVNINIRGQNVKVSISDYIVDKKDECLKQYHAGATLKSNSNAKGSFKEKAQNVKDLLQKYKNWGDSFSYNLADSLRKDTIECNGEELKETDSCDPGTLSPSNENFCLSKATSCSGKIQICSQNLNRIKAVQYRDMQLKVNAYNTKVQNLVSSANKMLALKTNTALSLVNYLNSRFPGTMPNYNKDLTIPEPTLEKGKYGSDFAILGNGDPEKLAKILPEKLDLLHEMLTEQNNNIKSKIADLRKQSESNMENEMQKWSQLRDSCDKLFNTANAAIIAQQNQAIEASNKRNIALNEFCMKYDALNTPNAGCGEEVNKLFEDSLKIAAGGGLNLEVTRVLGEYRNMCAQTGNDQAYLGLVDKVSEACEGTSKNEKKCAALQIALNKFPQTKTQVDQNRFVEEFLKAKDDLEKKLDNNLDLFNKNFNGLNVTCSNNKATSDNKNSTELLSTIESCNDKALTFNNTKKASYIQAEATRIAKLKSTPTSSPTQDPNEAFSSFVENSLNKTPCKALDNSNSREKGTSLRGLFDKAIGGARQ